MKTANVNNDIGWAVYCNLCIYLFNALSSIQTKVIHTIYTRRDCASVNTLRPRQNRRHFADDTFNSIFLNDNARISLKISLKFVPKVWINNIPALVQIMAWRRSGDKPLSEPMMVSLLTHICVTQPQWVNTIINVISKSMWYNYPYHPHSLALGQSCKYPVASEVTLGNIGKYITLIT